MTVYKNPDINKIYHLWHICLDCKKSFTHSQSDFDYELKKCNAKNHKILTKSTVYDESIIY
jgi:DNA-directed RNA polymerase subunit RPC12/RpoP